MIVTHEYPLQHTVEVILYLRSQFLAKFLPKNSIETYSKDSTDELLLGSTVVWLETRKAPHLEIPEGCVLSCVLE